MFGVTGRKESEMDEGAVYTAIREVSDETSRLLKENSSTDTGALFAHRKAVEALQLHCEMFLRCSAKRLSDEGVERCSLCSGLGVISKGPGDVTCPECGGSGTTPHN
jgi:DnaJ-class molecular chaperone